MATEIDSEAIDAAYQDVRSDLSDTNWVFLAYDEGNNIILASIGTEFEEFAEKFAEEDRAFGYVRIFTGDEMSKRAKFAMITWIGPETTPLKRAKVSTDKAVVKQVFKSFAKEIQIDDKSELTEEYIRAELVKAGGANYGTGGQD